MCFIRKDLPAVHLAHSPWGDIYLTGRKVPNSKESSVGERGRPEGPVFYVEKDPY